MQFLEDFEKQCGTQASVKRLRDHSSYHAFMTKWSLPVYYQIRYNVCKVMNPAGLMCHCLIYSFFYISVYFFYVKLRWILKHAILSNWETVSMLFAHGQKSLKLFTCSFQSPSFLISECLCCYPSCWVKSWSYITWIC